MPTESAKKFHIVGIGASAGGLEAFEQFFRHVPADSGMAYVLIPHLAPDHASLLAEILQRNTTMPVIEAVDQLVVEPDCVYIIPPNRDMAIFHGKLLLSIPDEPRGQRMPIDAFLRSLAEDRQELAIGIILSGTGTDGMLGLRDILGAGGITLVQEPATAKYDGMPNAAVQAGYATLVLPADSMPEALQASTRAIIHTETPAAPKVASGLGRILMQLRTVTGHDFSLYKKSTIRRRIERRMAQHNIEDTEIYARFLKENPGEVYALFRELLINVTSFFRDAEAFAALQKDVLPELLRDKPESYVFRVWVAGCATGEEAYSLAILLRELMEETQRDTKVQIYSTDLDDDAIATARTGVYPPNIAQDVTPERLRRYFVKEDNGYRVKKEIREMVVFATQNAIKDPPFTRLDLLSCRNLMIYLEPELQNRLIPVFHYALKPGGVLFLSPSESTGNHTELFTPLNRKWKLYRAIPSRITSRAAIAAGLSWSPENGERSPEDAMKKTSETNFVDLTRRILLQYFAPASVITSLKGDTLYVHGETGRYLRPAPGQASLNVIEMAREGLELELRAAIQLAAGEGIPTLNREMQVKTNGDYTTVSLSVRPLPGQDGSRELLLVSFQDVATPKPRRKRAGKTAELGRVEELERDLAYLKESQQANIEEQQASNEELKSTNEELQSTNEELQSTNEELETSKEELQSVNEELITVNSELHGKIEQLVEMQNDMKNLLENISTGIIFLDSNLKIRSFTREAVLFYRLAPSDVGRSLNDIKSVAGGDELLAAAQAVLDTLIPFETELRVKGEIWMQARILPYRTLDNMIDGVVLTFTDITARIKAVATEESLMLARSIVNTVREPLLVLNGALQVVSASRSFYRVFQVTPEETLDHLVYELGSRQWDVPSLRKLLESIVTADKPFDDYVVEHDFPVLGPQKMLLNARRIVGKVGEPVLILLAIEHMLDH